jgi:hypothetical protein
MKPSLYVIFLLLTLLGCASPPTQNTRAASNTATLKPIISKTIPATDTPTQTPRPTLTLSPVPPTIPMATLKARATMKSLEVVCDEYKTDSSGYARISPNGEWFAISCGYKRNQSLVVQNLEGTKWVFPLVNFLNPDLQGIMGNFTPLAWSNDGRFLYFTKNLGYDGGGNQCFPGYGVYGLYRLHLKSGNLVTLIQSKDDWFSGNEIRFSPTNEYYAVDTDGVKITNLESGKEFKIDVSGVMEMSWSPDGKFLAFSVATCGENLVESSSIFVWDSLTNQTQVLLSTNEMLLRPQSWIDNSKLRFEGEKWVGLDNEYTVFEYNLTENGMMFSGTATPRP